MLKDALIYLHLVAGLVEVDGVITSGRSHFLLLSVHYALYVESYVELRWNNTIPKGGMNQGINNE